MQHVQQLSVNGCLAGPAACRTETEHSAFCTQQMWGTEDVVRRERQRLQCKGQLGTDMETSVLES